LHRDDVVKETGVKGGQGHELYEEWRVLPDKKSSKALKLAEESRKYYGLFEN